MTRPTMLILVVLLCAGCDSDDEAESAAVASVEEEVEEVAGEAATEADDESPDPCALLTEGMVRDHLDVSEDVEIEQSRSEHSPHPICTYSWNTLSEEEQKKQRQEMVKRMMDKTKEGKPASGLLEMATEMGSEEVHLTVFNEPFESPEAARSRLDSIRERMEKGIKQKARGETVEFKSSYEAVEGVGSQAYWSPKQSQLSFADGNRIFHLGVKAKDESKNLDFAKELAAAVIEAR